MQTSKLLSVMPVRRWFWVTFISLYFSATCIEGTSLPLLTEAEYAVLVARTKREQPRNCQLQTFNLTIEDNGCVGFVHVFGCAGRCESTQIPHPYTSRHEAYSPEPWSGSCKCCSRTGEVGVAPIVTLRCGEHVDPVIKLWELFLPTDCGCTACS